MEVFQGSQHKFVVESTTQSWRIQDYLKHTLTLFSSRRSPEHGLTEVPVLLNAQQESFVRDQCSHRKPYGSRTRRCIHRHVCTGIINSKLQGLVIRKDTRPPCPSNLHPAEVGPSSSVQLHAVWSQSEVEKLPHDLSVNYQEGISVALSLHSHLERVTL